MTRTGILKIHERTQIETRRIDALIRDMGTPSAERLVGRAMDEIADRVALAEAAFLGGDMGGVAKSMRHLVPVARAIGLTCIVRVAGDVAATARNGDGVALAATMARLRRLSDGATHAVGEAWAAIV